MYRYVKKDFSSIPKVFSRPYADRREASRIIFLAIRIFQVQQKEKDAVSDVNMKKTFQLLAYNRINLL